MLRSNLGTLPLRMPSDKRVARKLYKSEVRAANFIRKMLDKNIPVMSSKRDGDTVVSYIVSASMSRGYREWSYDRREAAKTRRKPAIVYNVSPCVALVKVS